MGNFIVVGKKQIIYMVKSLRKTQIHIICKGKKYFPTSRIYYQDVLMIDREQEISQIRKYQ